MISMQLKPKPMNLTKLFRKLEQQFIRKHNKHRHNRKLKVDQKNPK